MCIRDSYMGNREERLVGSALVLSRVQKLGRHTAQAGLFVMVGHPKSQAV
jgi:hypothetical protein